MILDSSVAVFKKNIILILVILLIASIFPLYHFFYIYDTSDKDEKFSQTIIAVKLQKGIYDTGDLKDITKLVNLYNQQCDFFKMKEIDKSIEAATLLESERIKREVQMRKGERYDEIRRKQGLEPEIKGISILESSSVGVYIEEQNLLCTIFEEYRKNFTELMSYKRIINFEFANLFKQKLDNDKQFRSLFYYMETIKPDSKEYLFRYSENNKKEIFSQINLLFSKAIIFYLDAVAAFLKEDLFEDVSLINKSFSQNAYFADQLIEVAKINAFSFSKVSKLKNNFNPERLFYEIYLTSETDFARFEAVSIYLYYFIFYIFLTMGIIFILLIKNYYGKK